MKSTSRELKLKYLRYGMVFQLVVGGFFVYSTHKVSKIMDEVDGKYFPNHSLEQIKNAGSSNQFNPSVHTPQNAGQVLSGMNRAPFGGNPQYYTPPSEQYQQYQQPQHHNNSQNTTHQFYDGSKESKEESQHEESGPKQE